MLVLWDTPELVKRLAAERVSAVEAAQYLLALNTLGGFSLYVAAVHYAAPNLRLLYEFALYLLVACYGIWLVYDGNGGRFGDRLIERFVCLSFPLSLKVIVITHGLVGAYVYGLPFVAPRSILLAPPISDWLPQMVFLLGEFGFFAVLAHRVWQVRVVAARLDESHWSAAPRLDGP